RRRSPRTLTPNTPTDILFTNDGGFQGWMRHSWEGRFVSGTRFDLGVRRGAAARATTAGPHPDHPLALPLVRLARPLSLGNNTPSPFPHSASNLKA
ncbi:hypothetical protein HMPREF1549_02325, partial [Actinomyces johnsonii F0510]